MAIRKNAKLFVASSLCGIVGCLFLIVPYSTNYWVNASFGEDGNVQLGLFTGQYVRPNMFTASYDLIFTCSFPDNVCMWSCSSTEEDRLNELQDLLINGTASFNCLISAKNFQKLPRAQTSNINKDNFFQAGFWIATLIFLSLALLANCIAVGFNIYNVLKNPIEWYATNTGLYIYYGIAACSTLLALIIYGSHFAVYTSNNIALLDTLTSSMKLDISPSLNFSYFFLIIAEVVQITAVVLIYYRQYRINKAEEKIIVKIDDRTNDASMIMF